MKTILSLGAGVQSSSLALMCATGYLPFQIDAAIFADTQAEPPAVYHWLDWLKTRLPFVVYRVTRGNLLVDGFERRVSRKGLTYWKNNIPFFVATPTTIKERCTACGGTGCLDVDYRQRRLEWNKLAEIDEIADRAGLNPPECITCNGTGEIDTGIPTVRKGMMNRKCTAEYKIREIVKKSRAIVGAGVIRKWARQHGVKRERVAYSDGTQAWRWNVPEGTPRLAKSLIGISADEVQRCKPSREPWIENKHPLVDAGITRNDCLRWMRERGYPQPPRSACVFCPFHSDAEWARMKREDPESFRIAAEFEEAAAAAACGITRGVPFLHSSLKPLPQVIFKSEGQISNLFIEECEGICGV